ncbi:hypothetical protein [Flavitalea sp.]|nr:hypothetical protein [Flavitalea sp.]
MRTVIFYLLTLLFFFHFFNTQGQSEYFIGSSSISIEPDSSVFSLALAGYGAPRDGRFSIAWERSDSAPDSILLLTGVGTKLYAVNQNKDLLVKDVLKDNGGWSKLGTAHDIISLTGYKNRLYSVNSKHELLSRECSKKNAPWQKIGNADNTATLTIVDGQFYATNTRNELLVKSIHSGSNWKTIGVADSALCMTAYGNRIYTIGADQSLWMRKTNMPDLPRVKIGRYIRAVADLRLNQLAVANNRLYAVSSDKKVYISSHNSTGDLSARAIAIRKGKKVVVVVGFDVCGFDYSLATEIKSIINKKLKIPPFAIFLNCSHTHYAPVTQSFPTFGDHGQVPDSTYLNGIVKKGIIKAIESALGYMYPATIYFGRGTTNIGRNRSAGDQPGLYDNTVDVVSTVSENKRGNNILFLTGCHPVFKNEGKEGYTVSANFPGVAKTIIENKLSIYNAVFLQACAGDINPRDTDPKKTGADLAMNVQDVLRGNMQKIAGDISYALDTIEVPVKPWSKEKVEQFKIENSNKEGNVSAEKNVRWADMMLNYYENKTMPKTMPIYVQTINIGNWKLIGLSREVVTAYSFAIKKLWPDQLVSVVGYTNDLPSYLPAESHIKRQTYEGNESFFWNSQPSLFPENILDIVVEKIKVKNN